MHKGTVKWTDINQNYGFIIPDDNTAQNIFIHVSQFKKLGMEAPKDGQRVAFTPEDNHAPAHATSILPKLNVLAIF